MPARKKRRTSFTRPDSVPLEQGEDWEITVVALFRRQRSGWEGDCPQGGAAGCYGV